MIPDPISSGLGRTLLGVFFALHYLSALMTMGLAWTGAVAAWRGARRVERDVVAIAVINVSVTIVLGVAALLFVSVVYNRPFFTAALLLFPALMSVIAMLVVAASSLYAAKWLPALESRPRGRAAVLALAGTMAALVGAVFAAISALSWLRPAPGDDWMAMLAGSTWAIRYALELALAGTAASAAIVVRYGWSDADDYERGIVREAGMAGTAFCAAVAPLTGVLIAKLSVSSAHPGLAEIPFAGLVVAFLLAAVGRYRGRSAAVAVGGMTLLLVAGLAILREGLRSHFLMDSLGH